MDYHPAICFFLCSMVSQDLSFKLGIYTHVYLWKLRSYTYISLTAGWSSGQSTRLRIRESIEELTYQIDVYIHTYTYHSRCIPEGVAEISQIFLRDTHVLLKLVSYEEHCRRDRW
jgi:hypothetical protein